MNNPSSPSQTDSAFLYQTGSESIFWPSSLIRHLLPNSWPNTVLVFVYLQHPTGLGPYFLITFFWNYVGYPLTFSFQMKGWQQRQSQREKAEKGHRTWNDSRAILAPPQPDSLQLKKFCFCQHLMNALWPKYIQINYISSFFSSVNVTSINFNFFYHFKVQRLQTILVGF